MTHNMEKNMKSIEKRIRAYEYLITKHARLRMAENDVYTSDLEKAILGGDIIEEYPDDSPCPSVLMLGVVNNSPVHIVIGVCVDHLRIITIYNPSEEKWINSRKRR